MFNNQYVRTILLSRVLLQLGIWIRNFAVLLYVTDLTNNNSMYISLISIVEFAPIVLFAIIGGTFADRWLPKRTMVWSDGLSAVSVLVVLLAVLHGEWYALLLGTLVSAGLSQFSQPSAMKLYKKHVPSDQLQGVMAMSQSLVAIFFIIGPIIGSFIFIQYGIELSLLLTFIFFLGSALILSFLPKDAKDAASQEAGSFKEDMMAGFRYIWNNRSLRTLSATFAAAGLASGIIQPLMLFICIEKLGLDKSYLQWLLAVNGAAMLVGGVAIMNLARKVKPHILLAAGLLVSALCTLGVGASTVIFLSILLQIISGLFYPCVQVGIQTLIIKNTEAAFMGRVGGAITPIFMGMMVIGMFFSGYLKDMFSLFTVYAMSCCLLVIGTLLLAPLFQDARKKSHNSSITS
jgi:MFS family permease